MKKEYQSPFLDNRDRLFENKVGFVIYDGFPVSEGHCLIIPKRVYPDYFDSKPESIDALFEVLMWRLSLIDEDDYYSIPTY